MSHNLYDVALELVNSMNVDSASQRRPTLNLITRKMDAKEISPYSPTATLDEMCKKMTQDAEDQEEYIDALCQLINQTIKQNDPIQVDSGCYSPTSGCVKQFSGIRANFDATYYLKRISLYSEASPSCLITSLIYLERAQHLCPPLRLTSRTLQRLLLVAVMTATKYLEDTCCLNSRWAEIGGLSVKELNALEREFLSCLQYRLVVHPAEYAQCTARLADFAPRQGPDGGGRVSRRMSGGGTSPLLVTSSRRGSRANAAKTAQISVEAAQPGPPATAQGPAV